MLDFKCEALRLLSLEHVVGAKDGDFDGRGVHPGVLEGRDGVITVVDAAIEDGDRGGIVDEEGLLVGVGGKVDKVEM